MIRLQVKFILNENRISQIRCSMAAIPVLRNLAHKKGEEVKMSLGYIITSRLIGLQFKILSQKENVDITIIKK